MPEIQIIGINVSRVLEVLTEAPPMERDSRRFDPKPLFEPPPTLAFGSANWQPLCPHLQCPRRSFARTNIRRV